MEHPGLITFSEGHLRFDKPSVLEYSRRANTIVHELVHMWFGNLVTMKWWKDLWLKESFADFNSFLIMQKLRESKALGFEIVDQWLTMNLETERAYYEDSLITTHPIEREVENT